MFKNLSATITLGGTITIVVFVVLFSAGFVALLCWLTLKERRRFKAGRVSIAVKLQPLEKMLKQRLIAAKSFTKFTVNTIEIDNVAEIKSSAGNKYLKDLLEMAAARAVRQYNYPIDVAKHGNNRLVYISKKASDKSLVKQIGKVEKALSEPFINPEGGNINVKYNIGVIRFPDAGSEYSALLRGIEFSIADALRNNGVSIAKKNLKDDEKHLNNYMLAKRAIDKGKLTVRYTPCVNAFNKETIGYMAALNNTGDADYMDILAKSGDSDWLDKWVVDEGMKTVDRFIGRSGALLFIPAGICSETAYRFKDESGLDPSVRYNAAAVDGFIAKINEKEIFKEQLILGINADVALQYDKNLLKKFSNIALYIEVNGDSMLERYRDELFLTVMPRYAIVDCTKIYAEKERIVKSIVDFMDTYDITVILVGADEKSAFDLASDSGIEYVSGKMFGAQLTSTELIDSLN